MTEESTTSDLTELVRHLLDAVSCIDGEAFVRFFAPDAVFLTGVGRFEGRDAIRGYLEDFNSSYDERSFAPDEVHDLGNGVGWFSAVVTGRLRGSNAEVHLRFAVVVTHAGGVVSQWTDYVTIDEARAVAERLAQERGQAMLGENVEIVRRWIDAYNQRDYDTCADLLAPDVVFDASHRGFGVFEGRALVCKVGEAWVRTFDEFEMDLREVSDLGRGVVFTVQFTRGRPPGTTAYVEGWEAYVVVLEGGVILRYTNYSDIDEARAAAERLAKERG